MTKPRLRADFNGLFGDILCLSHSDICKDENGEAVVLREGMTVTVFDDDLGDDGMRDDLIATGTIEPSPGWLECKGSKWVLKIDEDGARHQSDIKAGRS